MKSWRAIAGVALHAAVLGACSEDSTAEPASGPAVRLVDLTELDAAVKRNLQRGALVALWATW